MENSRPAPLLIFVICSLALACCTNIFIPGAAFSAQSYDERLAENIAEKLDLTPDQKAQCMADAKQIDLDRETAYSANEKVMQDIRKELFKKNNTAEPNSVSIYLLMQQMSQNDLRIKMEQMGLVLKIRRMLTAEQKAEFGRLADDSMFSGNGIFREITAGSSEGSGK
jgi:Spy/CpxP family protein refolding chaperone